MTKMGVRVSARLVDSKEYRPQGVDEPWPMLPLSLTVNRVVLAVSAISNALLVVAPLAHTVSLA